MSAGTIVDASIICAEFRDRQRDPEMKQTKKGNAWYFGMKAHIGTDTQGRVHSVAVTHAAVHASTVMADCLHGEEAVIYGDKAYADEVRRQAALARGVDWRVSRKARWGKRLSCADKSFNRKSNRTRSRVEHAFGVIKHLWGYRKHAAQVFTLFALANFYLVSGIGRNMRINLSALDGNENIASQRCKSVVVRSVIRRFCLKQDNIFKNGA